jgi:hypothetical protein
MKKSTCLAILIALTASGAFAAPGANSQLLQDHPQFCGTPDTAVPAPPEISVLISSFDNHLFIRGKEVNAPDNRNFGLPAIDLIESAQEICPLSTNRYALFGELGRTGGTGVLILDAANATVVDLFRTYNPVLSPDKRWLAFREFYPPSDTQCEKYSLYNMQESPEQNHGHIKFMGRKTGDAGRRIFPVGMTQEDVFGKPDEYCHSAEWGTLSWSADGKALAFGDALTGKEGPDGESPDPVISIILIMIGSDGSTSASIHPWSEAAICPKCSSGGEHLRVKRIAVGPAQGNDRLVTISFDNVYPGMRPPPGIKDLVLHSSDFKPAKPETWVRQ